MAWRGADGPAGLAAVLVAVGVGGGGGEHAGGVEAGGDGAVADAFETPHEDLLHHRGMLGMGFESLELGAPPGLVGVGMGNAG